jgi:membrane associated rhomboid family serine protease
MAELSSDLLEIVLKDVAAAGAEPWYAADYAQATGVPRDRLDACLDRLRLSSLVRLTDWVQGRGQGYALTPEGEQVVHNPRLLDRLREGRELPRRAEARSQAGPTPTLREPGTTWDRGEAIRAALLDRAPPAVTRGLILANVVVFLVGLALAMRQHVFDEFLGFSSGNVAVNEIRHETGGLYPQAGDLARGQWWRLVTYAFVHGGLIHLLMNMYVLYVIGGVVEKMWGPVRYLALYLVSAVGGAAVHLYFTPRVGMVGASGGICGLLGSMGVWVMLNRAFLPQQLVSDWMRNIMLNVLLIAFISMVPGVSWGGHLGGGLAGAVVSVPLNFTRFGRGAQRWLGWVGVAAVPAVCVAVVARSVGGGPVQVDLPVDNPAVIQARELYRRIFLEAERLATADYEKFARPLLKGERNLDGAPETAQQYAARFKKTAKKLRELAADLDGAEAFGNRGIKADVAKAREFVEAWANFYTMFAKSLTPAENWGRQQRQDLEAEYGLILRLYEWVRRSALFRANLRDED